MEEATSDLGENGKHFSEFFSRQRRRSKKDTKIEKAQDTHKIHARGPPACSSGKHSVGRWGTWISQELGLQQLLTNGAFYLHCWPRHSQWDQKHWPWESSGTRLWLLPKAGRWRARPRREQAPGTEGDTPGQEGWAWAAVLRDKPT